jgi:hypothetical protein
MKAKIFCLAALFTFALTAANTASATVIDGYFKGFVYLDDSNPEIWITDPRAKEVSGYFSYDTLLAPTESEEHPGNYVSTNHWLDLYFDVGGRRINGLVEPRSDIATPRQERLTISDYLGGTFSIGVNINNEDDPDNYVQSYIELDIYGIPELLKVGSLVQNFSWQGEATPFAVGILQELGERNGVQYGTLQEMYITKLTVKPRHPVSVPEPSSFILFFLGLAGLFIRRFNL